MKTLQKFIIIIGAGIISSFVLVVIIPYMLETKPHTTMKIIGLKDSYNVYEIIRFQIYAYGYGYSCVGTPNILIYKTHQPDFIVYNEKSKAFMCPMEPQMSLFSVYYPSQNDYYQTAVEQDGNYTFLVSYREAVIEKQFMVITK